MAVIGVAPLEKDRNFFPSLKNLDLNISVIISVESHLFPPGTPRQVEMEAGSAPPS